MSKLSDLKKELRELRKQHCPPTGKMKKDDIQKELERLRGVEKHTEYVAPAPKPRVKKPKVEKKEMAVQADMDSEEEEERREAMAKRMAEVRARRKIAGAVTKAVEAKKEKKETEEKVETMKKKVAGRKVVEAVKKMAEGKKAKKEREMMAEEDVDVGKPKKRKLRGEGVTKEVTKAEEKPVEKKSKNDENGDLKETIKLGEFKKRVEIYNDLPKKQSRKKEQMEKELFDYVRTKTNYKPDEHPEILKHIFDNVKGVKEIYEKGKKQFDDKIKAIKEYDENLKEITKELKDGDIILDDENSDEWVVTMVDKNSVVVKKRKGKKEIEIEGGKGQWEEVLSEEEEEKKNPRDPLVFTLMFIKVPNQKK